MSSNLFSNQYPYTDAHELNLDWVIAETQAAVSTATVAKATADAISDTANTANNTAQGALNAAESAQSTAQSAINLAQRAQTTADSAKTTADDAKSSAEGAQEIAEAAKSDAADANLAANNAGTTANLAKTAAESAQTAANNAEQMADTAFNTASVAKRTADSAQSSVTQLQNQLQTGNYAKYTKFSFKGGTETGVFTAYGEITSGSVIVIIGVYDDTESHAVGGYAAIPLVINGVLNTMLPFGRVDGGALGIVISLQGTSGIKISGTITKYTYYVDLLDLTIAPTA